jgi:hypothetical protein
VNAPPAEKGNKRNARHYVQCSPDQADTLVGPDGVDIKTRREWFHASREDGGLGAPVFHPLAEVTLQELHHYLVCCQLLHLMSYNASKLHLRRAKLVMELLREMSMSPEAAARVGYIHTKEMEARVKTGKPVRTPERARRVANLLSQYGVIPPVEVEPVDAVVADATDPDDISNMPSDALDSEPAPLPEAAQRELKVRSIFDRGL